MREVIKEAKSVDEAVDLACEELGVPKEQITFEVLDLPKKGLFGLGGAMARVKVAMATEGETGVAEETKSYLNRILKNFECKVSLRAEMKENGYLDVDVKNLWIKDPLEEECFNAALQRLGAVYLGKLGEEKGLPKMSLSVNGLLQKREGRVADLAKNMAQVVLRTKSNATMEPMSSYDRMIVHSTISKIPGVKSSSVGDGRKRRVIIYCSEPAK